MIAFSIGPIDIHRYGIMYLITFIGGYIFAHSIKNRKLRSQTPRIQYILQNKIDDMIFIIFLGVMIGGRGGHVLIYDLQYFIQNPIDIMAVWKGGMSFIGGLIGVIGAIIIWARKQGCKRSEIQTLGDIILSFVPGGILLGRLGNFLNQELYGIIVPDHMRYLPTYITDFFKQAHIWHIYDKVDTALRINTNLLSALCEGLLLLIIGQYILYTQKKNNTIKQGLITAMFLTCYSTIRFVLEYLRQDSQAEFIGYFSKSQYFFIIFAGIGIIRLCTILYHHIKAKYHE